MRIQASPAGVADPRTAATAIAAPAILVKPDVREMHLATPPNLLSSGFRMDARRHSRKQDYLK